MHATCMYIYNYVRMYMYVYVYARALELVRSTCVYRYARLHVLMYLYGKTGHGANERARARTVHLLSPHVLIGRFNCIPALEPERTTARKN